MAKKVTLYLIGMLVYYVFTMPIKSIIINGTNYLTDEEIISAAEIANSQSLFRTRTSSLKRKISSLELVASVSIKKQLNGNLIIDIEEEKVLFKNMLNNKYVLSNKKEVLLDNNIIGIPFLTNYTPTEIYEELNAKMSLINSDIISLISEISYSPDIKNNVTIDEYRFILKMNDGNTVYINIANFDKLKEYKRLYSTIEEEKGIFYLDGNRKTVLFSTYENEYNKNNSETESEESE